MREKLFNYKFNELGILSVIISIIFAVSSGCFTLEIAITDNNILLLLSFIISVLFSGYLASKKGFISKTFENTTVIEKLLALYFSFRIIYEFLKKDFTFMAQYIDSNKLATHMKYLIIIGSFIFIFIIALFVIKNIIVAVYKFILTMDLLEKRYFILCSFLFTLIICIAYSFTSGFAQGYDSAYSMDSGYVTNEIFPKLYYFDIRHTLLSIITFPIGRLFTDIEKILGCKLGLRIILQAVFNGELLILIGILLKRMSKSKWILLIYTISNPFLIYMLTIEKFQLCTFFLVVFAYLSIQGNKPWSNNFLVLSVGSMTTTAVIGIFYGCSSKLKERIIEYLKVIINFAVVLILLGRITVLTSGITLISQTMTQFGTKMGLINRIYACFDLIASCFTASDYTILEGKFYWVNPSSKLNLLGGVIFAFVVISFILNYRDKFSQVCIYWIGFSFFLFICLGWSVHESQLFSLYFSWAIISLVIMGLEKILLNSSKVKDILFILISIIMLSVNIPHMVSLFKYFISTFPA